MKNVSFILCEIDDDAFILMPWNYQPHKMSTPVVWGVSEIPIVNGYAHIDLKLTMISPCRLMNASMIHKDLILVWTQFDILDIL